MTENERDDQCHYASIEISMMSNAKLEKKLYLAKESPEPVFDLSDCNLKHLPNICTTVKVLRKECLCLRNNRITDFKNVNNFSDLCLLTTLDLSFNKISELPDAIKYLINLQVLRLDTNLLRSLPNEIDSLLNLEQLTVSSNKLNALPESICNLSKLQTLDVRNNEIRSLPESIYRNRMLQFLLIDDNDDWENIPKSVIIQGTAEILSYFAKKNGVTDFKTALAEKENASANFDSVAKLNTYDKIIEDNLRRMELEKARMTLQRMNSEKNLLDQQYRELMAVQNQQNEKQNFLRRIIAEQQKLDEEVDLYQKFREEEQDKFIQQLKCVENTSDDVIKQLLETNAEQKKHSINSLVSSMNEPLQTEDNLHTKKVLKSMEKLLLEEYAIMKTIEEKESYRKNFINKVSAIEEEELQSKVESLLSVRHDQRKSLIDDIRSDTELQHTALLMLIEKSDSHNIELHNQITLIQYQLMNLTTLELQNKRFNMEMHVNEIACRRTMLSELLLDIFEQQQSYRKKMMEELRELEIEQTRKNAQNYWLMQYQRLLNLQPDAAKNINSSLLYELALLGVSHFAPLLAVSRENLKSVDDYSQIRDLDLKRVGINNSRDCHLIMKAIRNFVNQRKEQEVAPSAPEFEHVVQNPVDHTPSAPPVEGTQIHTRISLDHKLTNECVICMDEQSRVVFFPCGHLCSCICCSVLLTHCPLCRCDISQKMQIFTS